MDKSNVNLHGAFGLKASTLTSSNEKILLLYSALTRRP